MKRRIRWEEENPNVKAFEAPDVPTGIPHHQDAADALQVQPRKAAKIQKDETAQHDTDDDSQGWVTISIATPNCLLKGKIKLPLFI